MHLTNLMLSMEGSQYQNKKWNMSGECGECNIVLVIFNMEIIQAFLRSFQCSF